MIYQDEKGINKEIASEYVNESFEKLSNLISSNQKKIDELKARELLLKTPKSTTTPGTTGGATPPTTTKKNPQDYTIGDALFDVGVWSNKQRRCQQSVWQVHQRI